MLVYISSISLTYRVFTKSFFFISGTFSYTFNRQGTYYVSTGVMNYRRSQSDIFLPTLTMKHAIIVKPAPTISHAISVLVGEHEADYNAGEQDAFNLH